MQNVTNFRAYLYCIYIFEPLREISYQHRIYICGYDATANSGEIIKTDSIKVDRAPARNYSPRLEFAHRYIYTQFYIVIYTRIYVFGWFLQNQKTNLFSFLPAAVLGFLCLIHERATATRSSYLSVRREHPPPLSLKGYAHLSLPAVLNAYSMQMHRIPRATHTPPHIHWQWRWQYRNRSVEIDLPTCCRGTRGTTRALNLC